jgi:ABC-type Fe3+ transport system permease subunit
MGAVMSDNVGYVSGMGKQSTIPPEIQGWNWGAFFLNWIWGIGNSTYIAFLMFVPFVNLIMMFVLGAKGNEWAWQNRAWRDVDHFKTTQKRWRNAGLIVVCVFLPVFFVGITSLMKGEAYNQSLARIVENQEVIDLLGTPVEAGFFVLGNVSTSGPNGKAELQYSLSGPKGEAEAYVYAYKKLGQWELYQVVVFNGNTDQIIQVVTPVE